MIGVLKFKLTSGAKKYINGYYGAWDRVCSPWSCGGLGLLNLFADEISVQILLLS